MQELRITLVQSALHWEDPVANRNALEAAVLNSLPTDIIVLPEMFTTGFSMRPEAVAEHHHLSDMESLNWMRNLAKSQQCAITGSIAVKQDGAFFNRMYWVTPDDEPQWYDKRHLFTFAGENEHYTSGSAMKVVHWRDWKVLLQVCYDLRFPEGSRNVLHQGEPLYDLCLYVANWPEARNEPWKKLLPARAIENQCYLAGVNRVGEDGNGIAYSGDSVLIDPKGEAIASAEAHRECLVHGTCAMPELEAFRKKFPVLADRREW